MREVRGRRDRAAIQHTTGLTPAGETTQGGNTTWLTSHSKHVLCRVAEEDISRHASTSHHDAVKWIGNVLCIEYITSLFPNFKVRII